ncbi:MAG: hypothetical protein A3I26_02415 [Candidatus Yanofskybacteria bacterium RIFCSPLOWO2_02_FULL_43_10]|uniref:Uncharacterized protein n=1 Tax=Candidatus Yanofskybacteria bacterium RIFCSPLOWO2_12_FULL_43_11b TaxID=1802710 RepID=A0A1F8H7G2_9BACT|nr:MAG: hypothetical protein A2742_02640 [Candidatus Yanofskybacteria bacterium RIFCSPHIGHO2_01_FULL_43_32]OGN11083.1 MAG: hypothetical protein A3C69_00135 [Candidatus Yanofskybacteria bacterium RIFCSPHIGHO2_02_FULL_43_12]OGN17188.1 MAG: hypothetical protein A3E34_00250 [Candidatus Yanofskybacteria bacterium RIFCSPHIGHO2_12_FULL_43_11]OGN24986.1 MAG: hypothetical protein A2923_03385 [Candidatus Yanofskybacteria bacterium RIFCSPLOWO2_01_FULL_43_46]OGN30145.1 MAG: hypothetical protein A3I26_02415
MDKFLNSLSYIFLPAEVAKSEMGCSLLTNQSLWKYNKHMEKEFKPKRGPYTVEKKGEDFKVTGPHGIEKEQRIEWLNGRKVKLQGELKEIEDELRFLEI